MFLFLVSLNAFWYIINILAFKLLLKILVVAGLEEKVGLFVCRLQSSS